MKLDMIYSTFGERIYSLLDSLPEKNDNIKIIIVHQTNKGCFDNIENMINTRSDIKYYPIDSIGVTKSRNFGINVSTSDIILFCDDDVVYKSNVHDIIIEQYIKNPYADYITFQYNFVNEEIPAPKFKKKTFKHNLRTILSVGTIEITCRRNELIHNKIYFPEDMGAGTPHFLCDEPVFLSKFIKFKMSGIYAPKIIGSHPNICSGDIFNDLNAFISRKICFTRIFGKVLGSFLYLIYIIKNVRKFNSFKSFIRSLSIIKYKA